MPRNRGFGESAQPNAPRDPKLASEKQMAFILRLLDEKQIDAKGTDVTVEDIKALVPSLDKQTASAWIEKLLAAPNKPTADDIEPGVYETSEGIFVVKYNRAKTNMYAKKMVEINAQRATEAGERVEIEFDYAPGAIRQIKASDKMPLDRAKALTIRYGRCINCGRHLKAAESVERGIGPVCIKSFGG